jgi:hypothetical protein
MEVLFRRPLTTLFIIATLCVDACVPLVMPATLDSTVEYLFLGALIGQVWLAGSWLVWGQSHRLARAAGFILLTIGLATVISAGQRTMPQALADWGRVLAAVSIMAATTAVSASACRMVMGLAARRQESLAKIRFPIAELLGWMVIVAVASWVFTLMYFRHLASLTDSLVFVFSASFAAGVACSLALGIERPEAWIRGAFSVLIVVVHFAIFALLGGLDERDLWYGAYWAFLYLGIAAAAQEMDRRLAVRTPSQRTGSLAEDQ